MPPIRTPATCIHTLRHTFARAHRPQSQTLLWCRFCVPSPSLYYPVTREAYKPNKRINGGWIPWPSNLSLHLFCFPRYLSSYTPLYELLAFLLHFHRVMHTMQLPPVINHITQYLFIQHCFVFYACFIARSV